MASGVLQGGLGSAKYGNGAAQSSVCWGPLLQGSFAAAHAPCENPWPALGPPSGARPRHLAMGPAQGIPAATLHAPAGIQAA